jgi:hypothetical protein
MPESRAHFGQIPVGFIPQLDKITFVAKPRKDGAELAVPGIDQCAVELLPARIE